MVPSLGQTQVGVDPAPPRTPQGQHTQWTATDHIGAPPPCPYTADPPQRAEVAHKQSQAILAADWPKFLPLIFQQQPRLNYKRRVYSAHTKGAP